MDSSSVCVRKLGWKWWRKTQRNHFYTLLIKLPFWLEVLALKFLEKNLWKGLEKLAQKHSPNLGENNAQTPKFIGSEKLAVGVCQAYRSTARSTANGLISDRWSYRSTARSTVQIQRAELSGPVDRPVGRPTVLPDVHGSVHVGRPQGRPALVRSTVRSTDLACQPALVQKILRDKNLVFLVEIKSHKITENLQK